MYKNGAYKWFTERGISVPGYPQASRIPSAAVTTISEIREPIYAIPLPYKQQRESILHRLNFGSEHIELYIRTEMTNGTKEIIDSKALKKEVYKLFKMLSSVDKKPHGTMSD